MKNGDIELRHTDITNGDEPKPNGNSESKRFSLLDKIRAAIAFLTIEPFLICYILPNSLSSIAVQTLNLDKACRVDLNYTKEMCDEGVGNITTQTQSMVADMTTWQVPLQSSIPAIAILFVGAWSDRTGNRKALMMIPMFGELVSAFGLILTTHFFNEWPLFVTALIESLPTALSGGFSIALMGSYSYLADVTSLESRTFRIGIAAVLVTLCAPAAIAISGILLETIGYYGIFSVTTTMYVIGLVYTYYRIHDVKPIKTEGTLCSKLATFWHPRTVWDTICIAIKPGPNRAKVLLVIAAHIVIIGPVFGEGAILYQYLILKYEMDAVGLSLFIPYSILVSVLGEGAILYQYLILKYEMDAVGLSLFIPYSILVSVLGTTIAVTVFSKYLKMHDAFLGIIATACKVVSSCVYALGPTTAWLYSAPVFDLFGSSGVTAIRSLGTKVVEPEQVAKMCSLIGLVEAITPVVYSPMYSQTYKHTLHTFPGAFYLLGAAMTIPAFIIFIFIYVQYKKEERDKVKDPGSKEIHAHDNYVTKF